MVMLNGICTSAEANTSTEINWFLYQRENDTTKHYALRQSDVCQAVNETNWKNCSGESPNYTPWENLYTKILECNGGFNESRLLRNCGGFPNVTFELECLYPHNYSNEYHSHLQLCNLSSNIEETNRTFSLESLCNDVAPLIDGAEAEYYLPIGLKVPLGILMVLMIFVNIFGNSVVCLIVYQKQAMRSAINLLLANMAFSNILLAALCMTLSFLTLITDKWLLTEPVCKAAAFFHSLLVWEAIAVLCTISLDRYLIIVRRKDKLNPSRAKIFISTTWCFGVLLSLPPTLGWGMYYFYPGHVQCVLHEYRNIPDLMYLLIWTSVTFFIPMLTMTYAYFYILNTVRKNALRIHNHPESLTASQASRLGLSGLKRPPRVNVDMSFKTRAFKTILILFIVYIICWAPYAISMVVSNVTHSMKTNYISNTIILWISYMNSSLNPVIYCWRIKKFREACRELIPKSVRLLPKLPQSTKRRINPSAVYKYNSEQPMADLPSHSHQSTV
ncbi:unnamed protein product [Owenia fusiformis]|uniref:Uncharacterized protein n=1 Tax=Owenia fusiformis TaxID=6347 RepID=A0A8J1TAS8_OWEFU|nr:unnamed protein product [Owenia fusiformis]